LIDSSGDDKVDLEEFIAGCQTFGGAAKAIDMTLAMTRMDEMMVGLGVLMDYVEDSFTSHIPASDRLPEHSLGYRFNETIQLVKGIPPPPPQLPSASG